MKQVAAIVLVVAALAISFANSLHGRFLMGDFKAFYCAGKVLAQREDPYAAAPMAQCESVPAPRGFLVTTGGQVLPAPVPGYVAAAFVPLSLLPFPVAAVVWLIALLAAVVGAIAIFAHLGFADPWDLAVALSLTLLAVCIPVGELPPVALLGVAFAALGAQRGSAWLAGAGIALTFTEPQIGAALFVTACLLDTRFLIAAVGAVAALGIVSLLALGVAGNLEYVRVVLPAHLLSELPSVLQYSLSWILYRAGVAPSLAVLGGKLWWIAMLGVTALFARSAFARSRPDVAFVAAPVFVLVGGPFLHLDHISLAIPAALWLASRRPSPMRIAAVVSLCVPVLLVFSVFRYFALAPFVSGWTGTAATRQFIAGLRTALVCVLALTAIGAISVVTGTHSTIAAPVQALPANLPQASWATFVSTHFVMNGWVIWLVKAPIWFGVVATAAGLYALAQPRVAEAA